MDRESGGVSLSIRNVTKSFGSLQVLSDICMESEASEFIAIVGRSGCGKSTLLSLIAGLQAPTSGEIEIDGLPVTGIHPELRVLFQDSRLLPWKRVIDNVLIGVKNGDKQVALDALSRVGLRQKAGEWPRVLSGGEQQRVALARALSGNPRLLLLDEPLSALDALTRIEMQQLIERIWLAKRFNALLVTHDVSEAVTLADRVILIEGGRIGFETRIELARPRERNSSYLYYEKRILDRLIRKPDYKEGDGKNLSYDI